MIILFSDEYGLLVIGKAGLRGQGQIVGVIDSGMDDSNCLFFDDSGAYSTPYTRRDGVVEPLRRKVIQYTTVPGAAPFDMGHGTHVGGIVAGITIHIITDAACLWIDSLTH